MKMSSSTTLQAQDEPWWLPPCRAAIQQMGARMCTEVHCTEAEQNNHMICYCQPPFLDGCKKLGHPSEECCSYDATSPVFVSGPQPCYCCCGCFANETLIAVSTAEFKEIADFLIGDMVWVAMDADLSTWDQVPVAFSAGTGRTAGVNSLIRVRFGDRATPESVYANRDQLFMMADHKLKRAVKLVPGTDMLVRPDGSAVPVLDLSSGQFEKGVHHIATSDTPAQDVSGHLIVANGLVCGDYSLQLRNLEVANPSLMVAGHADLPDFGTDEYAAAYPHLTADSVSAAAEGQDPAEASAGFTPHAAAKPMPVPDDAQSFVTEQQARDIQKNGTRHAVYSESATPMVDYLFSLLSGFNPGVTFYLDRANELPNAYAFRVYGVPFVVINGGLARTRVMSLEGLALVLAQTLGRLYGGDPKDPQGYSCTGAADFAATAAVLPEAFFGARSRPIVVAGIEQVKELFGFIDEQHRGGVPGDTCNHISIDCRLLALQAGADSLPLPECAGGPPTATLRVTGATGAWAGAQAQVTVEFNEAIDPDTGVLGAFDFDPVTACTGSTVQTGARAVVIDGEFQAGDDYTVTAVNVLSANGHPLVIGRDTARFTMPPAPGGTGA
jgi:hypothetical protein